MIKYSGVEKVYSKKKIRAIRDASFIIEKGEFVFFMGESGAGKTTLLKMLYKAEKPSNGTIIAFGKDINKLSKTQIRRHVGTVFQNFELLETKTALENVSYVLECYGKSPRYSRQKASETLEMLGLGKKQHQKPYEMSGGERQRVAIARAVVNSPQILVCDEPTGNLDDENAENVMKYIRKINEMGTTVLMATHNKEIVKRMKKRIIYVKGGYINDVSYKNTVTLSDFISKKSDGVNL